MSEVTTENICQPYLEKDNLEKDSPEDDNTLNIPDKDGEHGSHLVFETRSQLNPQTRLGLKCIWSTLAQNKEPSLIN